jgi:hypothetical protein
VTTLASRGRRLFAIFGEIAFIMLGSFALRVAAAGPAVAGLTTFLPGGGGFLVIVREIAGLMLGAAFVRVGMAAAMARLATLAAGFGGAFAVVGKIPGTMLATDLSGARGLLTIFGEVSWVS